ncbi:MAG: hypothetical protein WCA46_04270 [Actinocatenispora sp.]
MDMTTSSPQAQPGGHPGQPVASTGRPASGLPSWGAEALVLVATAVVIAGLGAPLGLLWSALSARAAMVMTSDGALYNPETEAFASADGRFTLLTAAAGFLVAVLAWLVLRRYRGPLMLLAVGLGGAGSAWLASWVGAGVGHDDYDYLLGHAAAGWRFPIPLELGTKGALAVQALVTILVYTVVAGCSRFPGLHPARLRASWRRDLPAADQPFGELTGGPAVDAEPLALPPGMTLNALPPGPGLPVAAPGVAVLAVPHRPAPAPGHPPAPFPAPAPPPAPVPPPHAQPVQHAQPGPHDAQPGPHDAQPVPHAQPAPPAPDRTSAPGAGPVPPAPVHRPAPARPPRSQPPPDLSAIDSPTVENPLVQAVPAGQPGAEWPAAPWGGPAPASAPRAPAGQARADAGAEHPTWPSPPADPGEWPDAPGRM